MKASLKNVSSVVSHIVVSTLGFCLATSDERSLQSEKAQEKKSKSQSGGRVQKIEDLQKKLLRESAENLLRLTGKELKTVEIGTTHIRWDTYVRFTEVYHRKYERAHHSKKRCVFALVSPAYCCHIRVHLTPICLACI